MNNTHYGIVLGTSTIIMILMTLSSPGITIRSHEKIAHLDVAMRQLRFTKCLKNTRKMVNNVNSHFNLVLGRGPQNKMVNNVNSHFNLVLGRGPHK